MSLEPNDTTTQREITLAGFGKLEFVTGSQGALVWTEDLERRLGNVINSQMKSELMEIIRTGLHHEIKWKTEQQMQILFPNLDKNQIAATVEASNKISAKELVNQDECRTAVNAFLHNMMGKTSLEILMNDEIYNDNDLNAKDPTVAWARIMATHVHFREGSGTQKRFCAVNTMIGEFADIRQTETNESITEYLRRYERAQKALLNAGFDVESSWLDSEEKKVVKFLVRIRDVRLVWA